MNNAAIEARINTLSFENNWPALKSFGEYLIQDAFNVSARERASHFAFGDLCIALESGDKEFIELAEDKVDALVGDSLTEDYFANSGYAAI